MAAALPAGVDGLCGLWIDESGSARLALAGPDGRRETTRDSFRPFAWLSTPPVDEPVAGISIERLKGEAVFHRLAHGDSPAQLDAFIAMARQSGQVDAIWPLESQYLVQRRARLYSGLGFGQLRRCQLDIETGSADGSFSDAARPEDAVLAIGLRCGGRDRTLVLEPSDPDGERRLLEGLNAVLAEFDPDVIEGHNLFKFDLDYLRQRCRRFRVPCAWGRFGQEASFRRSRLKLAERWIDFPRCDLPGRAVADTYLLVQLHDLGARAMASYGLKEAAVHFGITPEGREGRTHLEGPRIHEAFRSDRGRFLAYLADDLRETAGLAGLLLPTYVEQARSFPILLQEAILRGTTGKIDLLFLEEYYHARQACPAPPAIGPFEGGFARSFRAGVFRHVLHFDVASLYPSLLLQIGRNPVNDRLGVFIPLLSRLREYRLRCKLLAREAETAEMRAEYQARQASFKILINSFYGYLGFSGARFGDGELAAEVTQRGRELLQALIREFEANGCAVLEADTDGLYLSAEAHFAASGALLERVARILPPGIELEFGGQYQAMFCYKAKNYALYDGARIILRGSALRSRGIEPYLKRLTDRMIAFLLGAAAESPLELLKETRRRIADRTAPVAELARSEILGQNPEAYEQFVAAGGKPRRAAAEAALRLSPRPRMGDRIAYYLAVAESGQNADWQRARPVSGHDQAAAPYDPAAYLAKLDDWLERYGPFLGVKAEGGVQGDLL